MNKRTQICVYARFCVLILFICDLTFFALRDKMNKKLIKKNKGKLLCMTITETE